jgi:polar amino acid transport system substrate-binding protein
MKAMKHKMRWIGVLLGIITLFAFGGSALAQSQELVNDSSLTKTLKSDVVKVGINPGYAPFEMIDEKGKLIGFDVDIANIMAKLLGVKLDLVTVAWEGIIPGLQVGKYDVIICGLTRKMERTLKIGFTDPYFTTGQMVLINNKKRPNVKDFAQLNSPKVDITVMQGTSGHIATMKALPKANIKNFTSREEAAMMVGMGRADAFVFDEPLIRYYLAKYSDTTYTIEGKFLTTENLAFGVRWGDPIWREWLNIFIYQIQNVIWATDEDVKEYGIDPAFVGKPIYQGLYHKWFVSWMKEAKKM